MDECQPVVSMVVGGTRDGESIELSYGLPPPAIYRLDVCAVLYECRVTYVWKSLKLGR